MIEQFQLYVNAVYCNYLDGSINAYKNDELCECIVCVVTFTL